jgi:galactonate dehydratase
MKITDLRCLLINPGFRPAYGTGHGPNWVIIRLETDEGLVGYGEAFSGVDEMVVAAVEKFKRQLQGQDPTNVAHLARMMYHSLRYPPGTATLGAISGIEQACWDVAGKACGLPVYRMLGGPTRARVRAYASPVTWMWDRELQERPLADAARSAVNAGYTALKLNAQPADFATDYPERVVERSIQRVARVREAIGPDVGLALEYYGRGLHPALVARFAREVERFNPLFLEEPFRTEDVAGIVQLKQKTTVPLAGGERCLDRANFQQLMLSRALDVVQPEPCACGGILETIKRAHMAELCHVLVAPHQAGSPLALAVCGHLDMSLSNILIQEINIDLESAVVRDVFPERPTVRDGFLNVSDKPGLGVEIDESAAHEYAYAPHDRQVHVSYDGSVAST